MTSNESSIFEYNLQATRIHLAYRGRSSHESIILHTTSFLLTSCLVGKNDWKLSFGRRVSTSIPLRHCTELVTCTALPRRDILSRASGRPSIQKKEAKGGCRTQHSDSTVKVWIDCAEIILAWSKIKHSGLSFPRQ